MEFPRQEYWSELPFSFPGDLPNLGIEPPSPALASRFFTTGPLGKLPCPGWGESKMPRSLPRELILKPPWSQRLRGTCRVSWYFLVSQRKPGSWLHPPCWGDRVGGGSWKRVQVCSLCCSHRCPQQCALQLTLSGWLLPTNTVLVEGKGTVNQEASFYQPRPKTQDRRGLTRPPPQGGAPSAKTVPRSGAQISKTLWTPQAWAQRTNAATLHSLCSPTNHFSGARWPKGTGFPLPPKPGTSFSLPSWCLTSPRGGARFSLSPPTRSQVHSSSGLIEKVM